MSRTRPSTGTKKGASGSGESQLRVQTWRQDKLAPACARRGRNPHEFLLEFPEPGEEKNEKRYASCSVCKVDVEAKNEKHKHRHELSKGHQRKCAEELQVKYEDLKETLVQCDECPETFTRADGLKRHQRKTGHHMKPGTAISSLHPREGDTDAFAVFDDSDAEEISELDTSISHSSSLPSTPSTYTSPLASGSSTPLSHTWFLAPTSPPTTDYSSSPMSYTSSLGPEPALTPDNSSSPDSSLPPTPCLDSLDLPDFGILSVLLQALSPPELERLLLSANTPNSEREPVFSQNSELPSVSYLRAHESSVVSGDIYTSALANPPLFDLGADPEPVLSQSSEFPAVSYLHAHESSFVSGDVYTPAPANLPFFDESLWGNPDPTLSQNSEFPGNNYLRAHESSFVAGDVYTALANPPSFDENLGLPPSQFIPQPHMQDTVTWGLDFTTTDDVFQHLLDDLGNFTDFDF